jgi:hypothetical protein
MGIAITKLQDGARNVVLHVHITGEAGELSDVVVLDPGELDPSLPNRPTLTIDQLWYDISGFSATLLFDHMSDGVPAWTLSEGNASHVDFCCIGGLKDRSPEMDGTGKLLITTVGLGVGDSGTVVLKLRKD